MQGLPISSSGKSGLVIVMCGRNAAEYVEDAFAALARQTYKPKAILVLDDCSNDGTPETVNKTAKACGLFKLTKVLRFKQQQGKARNVFEMYQSFQFNPDDVLVMHDLDDYLSRDDALEILWHSYSPSWDVVHSNFERLSNLGKPGFCGQLDPFSSARVQTWRTSHLFSFKAHLLETMTASDCQDDKGTWFMAACDMLFAFYVTDRTPYIKYIDDVLLVYRDNITSNLHASPRSLQFQKSGQKILRNRKISYIKQMKDSPISMFDLMQLKSAADIYDRQHMMRRLGLKT